MTPLEIGLLVWAVLATIAAARYRKLAWFFRDGWRVAQDGWRDALVDAQNALNIAHGLIDAAKDIHEPPIDAHSIRKDLMN